MVAIEFKSNVVNSLSRSDYCVRIYVYVGMMLSANTNAITANITSHCTIDYFEASDFSENPLLIVLVIS